MLFNHLPRSRRARTPSPTPERSRTPVKDETPDQPSPTSAPTASHGPSNPNPVRPYHSPPSRPLQGHTAAFGPTNLKELYHVY